MSKRRFLTLRFIIFVAAVSIFSTLTFATSDRFSERLISYLPASFSQLAPNAELVSSGPVADQIPAVAMAAGTCETVGPVEVEGTIAGVTPMAYGTLKSAFDAINAGTHTGSISIDICGNTTETATASLNSSGGTSSYTDVTIRPVGGPRSITGSVTGAIVKLNGADNVLIDGRQGGTGTSRDLSIVNSSNASPSAGIWLASVTAGNGATNNVIRNLEIACGINQVSSGSSSFGIIQTGTSISLSATDGNDNDNNQFLFNRIIRVRYGIASRGVTGNNNLNATISDNIIGPTSFGGDQIGKVGIFSLADTGALITHNTIQFVGAQSADTAAGVDRFGIAIGAESWSQNDSTTATSGDYTVTKNVIHDIGDEKSFSVVGIRIGSTRSGTATNNLIANNFIFNIRSNGQGLDQVCGIGWASGHTDKIVFNSISITGDQDPGSVSPSTGFGNAIRITATNATNNANLTVKNNSIYLDASSSTAAVRYYAIAVPSTTYSFGTGGIGNNNYYRNPTNAQTQTGGQGISGLSGASALTTSYATLPDWTAAYSVDTGSKQADPLYVSNTSNLHLQNGSPNDNSGTTISGIIDDIDGETRAGIPDIGADEITSQSPPTATNLSAAETYTEDSPLDLTNIVIADADSLNVTATLTLSNIGAGGLSTATSGSTTSTFDPTTGVWSAAGPIADVNTLLAVVTFNPSTNFNSNFSIATSITDGTTPPVTGSKTMTGSPVNDAPQATNLSSSETYTEDEQCELRDIVVSDVDNISVTATLTLSTTAAGSISTGTSGSTTSVFNPGTGIWSASGPVGEVNAVLAAAAYVPATNYDANFSITTSVSDGIAPAVTGMKQMLGVSVNDAPALDASKNPALNAEQQDVGAPVGAIGTPVSNLVDFAVPSGGLDNVTDGDTGPLLGVAVISADVANGSWFFTTDGGANWLPLGPVSDSGARLLVANSGSRLYFQPNAGYFGSAFLTLRAWDQTQGLNGTIVASSPNGGSTAFSSASDQALLQVTSSDVAPPDTSFIEVPPLPLATNRADFKFTGSDLDGGTGVAAFDCSLDFDAFTSCSSPLSVVVTFDVSHTLRVRARDGAGNADPTPATFTWTPSPGVGVKFLPASYIAPEGMTTSITLLRTGSTTGSTSVEWSTLANGTASNGTCGASAIDYETQSGTVIFDPGESSKTFDISICGDVISDSAESFSLRLSNISGGGYDYPYNGEVRIRDAASQFSTQVPTSVPTGGVAEAQPLTITGATAGSTIKFTIFSITSASSDNLDFLLVGPQGQTFVPMADAGGNNALQGNTITLEDSASVQLPDGSVPEPLTNYRPAACTVANGGVVANFGGAASDGPYGQPGCTSASATFSSIFGNSDLNGTWHLFIRDDGGDPVAAGVASSIGGWGLQFLAPTAAQVEVSGRVMTPQGLGIRGAVVTITGGDLGQRTTVTGTFGTYHFSSVPAGVSYVLTVQSKRYVFAQPSRMINVQDSVTGADFISQP